MKKIFTILVFASSLIFGQNGFYQLDFESSGGYITSNSEFSDGSGDFFIRTDGSNIGSFYEVTGQQGVNYFAAMDTDGEPEGGDELSLTIENVDISGQSGLVFSILLAEDESSDGDEDWDANSYFHITYSIDSGSEVDLIWVESRGGTNTEPAIDTDFDGVGDGVAITPTFTEHTASIPGTGSLISIKIYYSYLDAGDEDISIDNIRLGSDQTPLPVELTTFTASILDDAVNLNWETATEVNNYGFDIERQYQVASSENQEWNKVGFVRGHGNSNSPKFYTFSDNSLTEDGDYSYRLKQVDIDGQFEYSDVVNVSFTSPLEFELGQNYPNPFNPNTQINFTLSNSDEVRLTVYNILGEEVARLVNSYFDAGKHSVEFNAEELNSGVYVYKLETSDFIETRKMILMK